MNRLPSESWGPPPPYERHPGTRRVPAILSLTLIKVWRMVDSRLRENRPTFTSSPRRIKIRDSYVEHPEGGTQSGHLEGTRHSSTRRVPYGVSLSYWGLPQTLLGLAAL